eukprot:jgi/Mesen1/2557/ME000162S01687
MLRDPLAHELRQEEKKEKGAEEGKEREEGEPRAAPVPGQAIAISDLSFGVASHMVEHWLALSLQTGVPSAVRVDGVDDADVYFVPFYSSLAQLMGTNHPGTDVKYHWHFMNWLVGQPAWQRRDGGDHVIGAVHPLCFRQVIGHLKRAHFLVADFYYYHRKVRASISVSPPPRHPPALCCLCACWCERKLC